MNIRFIKDEDLLSVTEIYNQGIEDRVATLEYSQKVVGEVSKWLLDREDRYSVIVAEGIGEILGWAAINPYSHR